MTNTVHGPNAAETIRRAIEEFELIYHELPCEDASLGMLISDLKSLKVAEWRSIAELPEELKDGRLLFLTNEEGITRPYWVEKGCCQQLVLSSFNASDEDFFGVSHFLVMELPEPMEVVG